MEDAIAVLDALTKSQEVHSLFYSELVDPQSVLGRVEAAIERLTAARDKHPAASLAAPQITEQVVNELIHLGKMADTCRLFIRIGSPEK